MKTLCCPASGRVAESRTPRGPGQARAFLIKPLFLSSAVPCLTYSSLSRGRHGSRRRTRCLTPTLHGSAPRCSQHRRWARPYYIRIVMSASSRSPNADSIVQDATTSRFRGSRSSTPTEARSRRWILLIFRRTISKQCQDVVPAKQRSNK
jgi:hypothetical protein